MKKLISCFVVITALGMQSCNSDEHINKSEKNELMVTTPLLKDTILSKEYVCQINSIQHIEIRALEKGYLQKVYVDEGQKIKQGQLMFQVMPLLYQAEYNKAAAEVELSRIEFLNTKSLADSNIVSPNELAMARAKYDIAKAELGLAKVHLEFTAIRAPFDGIVGRFHARLGSLIDEGHLLTSLSDNNSMWVYFNVPEAEYLNYEVEKKNKGLEVDLRMANNQFFSESGFVETIEADFNNETGNIAFRAIFKNPKGLLRHGETGSIILTSDLKGATMIPQKATFEILDKKFVFLIDSKGMVRSKEIVIGGELQHLFIVESGLKKDDVILLDGLRKVTNGDRIIAKKVSVKEAYSNLNLYAE
ncbi:MAG: membrane fusion protein (multidrug efflux system) [Lentimonas sp.]|jgi:membrane fusion protein (multidrug efflux system)